MNGLVDLQRILQNSKQEVQATRSLYLVMEKVGGYEQLMNLPLPTLHEILRAMEYFANEEEKAMKKAQSKRRR